MPLQRRFVSTFALAPLVLLMCSVVQAQETVPAGSSVAAASAQIPVAAAGAPPVSAKGKKNEYTGPTSVVMLAPTPMLDEEGRQRVDPNGKLMFNPPVAQQRDKKGHPLFDDKGKPVFQTAKDMGYDETGHKIHIEKEKPAKAVPVSISRGVMTVDGYTGKAALNYDIPDLKYIYLYAPGIGIAVVSNVMFPGATEQAGAFDDRTLTVTVNGHVLQVASDNRLLGKKPESAFVRVDREFVLPSKFPVVGYGNTNRPPYMWPGAKPNKELAGVVQAPPVPRSLLPVQLLKPCPAGYMRPSGASVLPGQVSAEPACVPIAKAAAPTMSASASKAPAVNGASAVTKTTSASGQEAQK